MKTSFILFVLLVYTFGTIKAQDVIHFRDGKEVKAVVKKVLSETVEYVKFDNPEGPIYEVFTSKLFKINYANGTQDVFLETQSGIQDKPQINQSQNVVQGDGNIKTSSRTKNNEVKIEMGDIIKIAIDTTSRRSGNNSGGTGNSEANKNQPGNNSPVSTTNNSDPCRTNKTGDASLINKTQFPLTVFLYDSNGKYFKTVNIPLDDSTKVYMLNEGVYRYSFKPSNSGQIDPITNKLIQYFEIIGEFYVKQCIANSVQLKK